MDDCTVRPVARDGSETIHHIERLLRAEFRQLVARAKLGYFLSGGHLLFQPEVEFRQGDTVFQHGVAEAFDFRLVLDALQVVGGRNAVDDFRSLRQGVVDGHVRLAAVEEDADVFRQALQVVEQFAVIRQHPSFFLQMLRDFSRHLLRIDEEDIFLIRNVGITDSHGIVRHVRPPDIRRPSHFVERREHRAVRPGLVQHLVNLNQLVFGRFPAQLDRHLEDLRLGHGGTVFPYRVYQREVRIQGDTFLLQRQFEGLRVGEAIRQPVQPHGIAFAEFGQQELGDGGRLRQH